MRYKKNKVIHYFVKGGLKSKWMCVWSEGRKVYNIDDFYNEKRWQFRSSTNRLPSLFFCFSLLFLLFLFLSSFLLFLLIYHLKASWMWEYKALNIPFFVFLWPSRIILSVPYQLWFDLVYRTSFKHQEDLWNCAMKV